MKNKISVFDWDTGGLHYAESFEDAAELTKKLADPACDEDLDSDAARVRQ